MTPASLIAWRTRLGYSKAKAARELGLSRNAYWGYEAGRWNGKARTIPKYVALACAALLAGLEPLS